MKFSKLFSSLIILLFISLSLQAQSLPGGFSKVKEEGGITEYRLDKNDLSILFLEDHSAPVVTFMATYRVGSRNEVTGTTGSTHILEHLMFKGTEKFNKDKGNHIDEVLGNLGAMLNASTWMDRTNYFEVLPSENLELAIEIEADRMRNLLLREEDRESEMTVVRNEFEQGENSPFGSLDKEIWATAIQAHPYHHSTIGWKSDIENVPIEKLREFYNTFYWPNNTTVTVIGDFNPAETLNMINKYYGKIPKSPHTIPVVYTKEPEQQGQRRIVLKRSGQVGVVGVAHKVPEGLNKDTYALSVLDKILTEGKTSRFYKELIDKNLAMQVFDFYVPLRDPSLFIPYAFLTPGTKHEDVEKVILSVYDDIKNNGVTEAEVNRAINQITAETAYDRDGSFSIASQLNEAIASGDWTFYVNYLDNIKKVTTEDVQNVVKKYMVEEKSTVGYFIPKSGESVADGEVNKDAESRSASHAKHYYRDPGLYSSENTSNNINDIQTETEEVKLSDNITKNNVAGIDVITAGTNVDQVVTFRGSFAAGDAFCSGENVTAADLAGNMLDKGTTEHAKFEIAGMLEDMGAELNFSASNFTLDFSGKCLNKDFDKVMELLAEQLRTPAFNEEEFQKLVEQRKGNFRRQMESTNTRATEMLDERVFPEDHPNNGAMLDDMIAALDNVTLNEVREFYSKYYGPQSMIFVAVGDITPQKSEDAINKYFSGWTGGVDYPDYDKSGGVGKGRTEVVMMEDKSSATLEFGMSTGLTNTSPDYMPFYIGNDILGHPGGFSGRLMSIIRDDEGLTYGIYSWHAGDTFADGKWVVRGAFAPQLLKQGIISTEREIKRWYDEGVTADELRKAKERLSGSYKVQLATTNGIARQLLDFAERGYDVNYIDQYPEDIRAVTLDEVNSAIKKYIDPDKIVKVIAGTVDKEEVMSAK